MRRLIAYACETAGAAAAEFALVLGVLVAPLLGLVDVGTYVFQAMQVHNAAQAAAQSARATCSAALVDWPVSSNCSAAATNMVAAAQSTTLGTKVSIVTATEGYYCVTSAGALAVTAGANSGPVTFVTNNTAQTPSPALQTQTTCGSGSWAANASPGDYVEVSASYPFTSVFGGLSIAKVFGSTITQSTWMRID
ncbi:MAG TPA: TadE/TadG family type IV pilus assembly protein [Caulobacteraceae bacterium]|nr:TadE/TadG family type IV pilus assembly protein [Caulobacteraceae bacterium]